MRPSAFRCSVFKTVQLDAFLPLWRITRTQTTEEDYISSVDTLISEQDELTICSNVESEFKIYHSVRNLTPDHQSTADEMALAFPLPDHLQPSRPKQPDVSTAILTALAEESPLSLASTTKWVKELEQAILETKVCTCSLNLLNMSPMRLNCIGRYKG